MSIAVLTEVYQEMRRLAIAGSMVAPGDFRLKKLLPPLEQAGAKAPVFAKVAEAVKAVVESQDSTSAAALLELTTLVNAILYTQGEVGAAGTLEPIDSTDLGATATQASARVLKPLLEALTTTGSGRFELIRDAHERGAFRDLRLVKPALAALDDSYSEIADFVAEKVLPLYGKAIVPELQATFDPKGRGGHPRRLKLLHQLDPAGSREVVKNAVEHGCKEVKIVAIECLGEAAEDLSYLLEQVSAKAQEVRQAAYRALAKMEAPEAVSAMQKAAAGKELGAAFDALRQCRVGQVMEFVLAEAEKELAGLAKAKDKEELGKSIHRLGALIRCLWGRDDKPAVAFLLDLFQRRAELAKLKGADHSGADLNEVVVMLLGGGSRKLQAALAEAHATLSAEQLPAAFRAAQSALPADQVFAMFSPYLTAKVDEKKKQRDPAWAKREALLQVLGVSPHYGYWSRREEGATPLDPRWLDVAVQRQHLGLVRQLARPGHAGANAFLLASFQETIHKAKNAHDCHEVVAGLIQAAHPQASDAYVAVLEKFGKKADYYSFGYWLGSLIVDLPKSALPRLEALIPHLNDKVADSLLGYLQQLREKKETAEARG